MRQGLDDDLRQFLTDILTLQKRDGQVFENIKAHVSPKGILIMDIRLPIEVGDRLIQTLPNGLKDVFIVDDPGYRAAAGGYFSARFEVKVHRADADPTASGAVTTGTISGTPAEAANADAWKVSNETSTPKRETQGEGKLSNRAPAPKNKVRKRKCDPVVQRIKQQVRELRAAGLSHQEICKRLGSADRPPHAAWKNLTWPQAYLQHPAAVRKWLSEACS